MKFIPASRWIWLRNPTRSFHQMVCFRRTFRVGENPRNALLHITADSRYEIYINDQWIGHGPPRSWPTPWTVDTYDISRLLLKGKNTLSILVTHYGTSTFQYLHTDPGLLAQCEWKDQRGKHRIVTNGQWRATEHNAFLWPVKRISCQMAWEEQYDARRELRDASSVKWTNPDYDDSSWDKAKIVARPGEGKHQKFEFRDIPSLSRNTRHPIALKAVEAVITAPYGWSINLREWFNPADKTSNMGLGRVLILTHIYSPRIQKIQLHQPVPIWDFKLNGETLTFNDQTLQKTDSGVSHASLTKGWNTLLCRIHSEVFHMITLDLNIWTDSPIRFHARPKSNCLQPWLFVGPFDDTDLTWRDEKTMKATKISSQATVALYEKIWKQGNIKNVTNIDDISCPSPPETIAQRSIDGICLSERVNSDKTIKIEQPEALLHHSDEWSILQPTKDNNDARLLLDFGDEYVGFITIEIDAPEGTIIDTYGFEFIQKDGRINLAEGNSNCFRYICREGEQSYRTFQRRGFRYLWLSFRNVKHPIRIRSVTVLESTYPVNRIGTFDSDDTLLSKIWQVGTHTVQTCMEDTYCDCPVYEQVHWVGDSFVEMLIDLTAFKDARLSQHCWIQAGRSLDRSPLVESNVPSGWQNILPNWSMLWMRWAYWHYQLTGDKSFARKCLPILAKNIEGIRHFLNPQNLLEIRAWNLFDWAPIDNPDEGVVTHQNCLTVLALDEVAMLAKAMNELQLARQWRQLAKKIKSAINKYLWDEKHQAYFDSIHKDGTQSSTFSQQTQVTALISSVAKENRKDRCREIVDHPPRGFVRAGSPFFMFFLIEAYDQEHRYQDMLKVIRSYWGSQIEAGATTFWEMYHPDEPRNTRSHCHGWSSAPTYFITRSILGVQPAQPGFGKILIQPQINLLKKAHGIVPTPRGNITVTWHSHKGICHLDLSWPDNTPVQVVLPKNTQKIILSTNRSSQQKTITNRNKLLFQKKSRATLHIK